MRIVVDLNEVSSLITRIDTNLDGPIVDIEAILDYLCDEYITNRACIESTLSDCLEAVSAVKDCDYCEQSYYKTVSELHQLIVIFYGALDRFRLRQQQFREFTSMRLLCRWKELYVFELK